VATDLEQERQRVEAEEKELVFGGFTKRPGIGRGGSTKRVRDGGASAVHGLFTKNPCWSEREATLHVYSSNFRVMPHPGQRAARSQLTGA
jgi:hypothetical protein